MTYVGLNGIFLILVLAVLIVTAAVVRRRLPWRAMLITLAIMLVLTAIFDNVIIGIGLVAYDDTLLSGFRIGVAPVEDFAYTVAVAVLVPCMWMLTSRKPKR